MSDQVIEPLPSYNALLLCADGSLFFGQGIGVEGVTTGEICFNTALTGYQEILSDPSYAGQIITFTFPHIGNVGANSEDIETNIPAARGLIIRNDITSPSNHRAHTHFNQWLKDHKLTGIAAIDTRALTRLIRQKGPQNVLICFKKPSETFDIPELKKQLERVPSLKGMELAETVTCDTFGTWNEQLWDHKKGYSTLSTPLHRIVAIDYGAKLNILRCLSSLRCEVVIVPSTTSYEEILSHHPDGIFLSNGPGDPSATGNYALPVIRKLIDKGLPIFGICLGHQMLALALGAKTEKMHQGHRGANHPVKNLLTGAVEITSQNHGFVVTKESIPSNVMITHVSLFDGTVEGIQCKDKPVFSVQYHPESSPGPHDSRYLFEQFIQFIENAKKTTSSLKQNAQTY